VETLTAAAISPHSRRLRSKIDESSLLILAAMAVSGGGNLGPALGVVEGS
jgi:hypothetical protein